MLGHEPQRDPFSQAGDEDGHPANRRRVESLETALDQRQRRGQRSPARPVRPELVAVLVVVAAEPARAEAEYEPPARDVVDGARHVGEQLRVAVRVTADERPQLHARRLLRPRGEERPALEVCAVALPVQRKEVIPRVERGRRRPPRLGRLHGAAPRRCRAAGGAGRRRGSVSRPREHLRQQRDRLLRAPPAAADSDTPARCPRGRSGAHREARRDGDGRWIARGRSGRRARSTRSTPRATRERISTRFGSASARPSAATRSSAPRCARAW